MSDDQVVENGPDPMRKYDLPVLREIQGEKDISKSTGIPRALFIPSSYGEAIEMAKMMCSGIGVPAYLRGSPSNCLAVLMQASRWGLDPYAVASKSYFVNDMIAYESQLVNAVVTTSGVLQGRLKIRWEGQDNGLRCFVEGFIRGDDEWKVLSQAIARVKVKNSPLWIVNPEQQLAYLTTRAWARLYIPEVLLGVYTPDEVIEGLPAKAAAAATRRVEHADGPVPSTPRRADFGAKADVVEGDDPVAETDVKPEADVVDEKTGDDAPAEERTIGPVPVGFETWEAWAASVVTRMKVAANIPKLDAVAADTLEIFNTAPDEIQEHLTEVYQEKLTDHREAVK